MIEISWRAPPAPAPALERPGWPGGLDVPEDAIWTSALATATFLEHRRVGVRDRRGGLTTALHAAGYTLTDRDPDFVVLSEARTYSASSGSRPRSG